MKTCQEWSLAFDTWYNNITSNKAPGVNLYEKSVFLTDAQNTVVVGLYNGSFGKPFESTEDVANILAPLVRQTSCVKAQSQTMAIAPNGVIYELPSTADEMLFRTLEVCTVDSKCEKDEDGNPVEEQVIVVPITQDEYWRTIRNPFKKQNDNRVLRLIHSLSSVGDNDGKLSVSKFTELISDREIKQYVVRYIARPKPIILEDMSTSESEYYGLTINGERKASPCMLDDSIHQAILEEAVRMAKSVWLS